MQSDSKSKSKSKSAWTFDGPNKNKNQSSVPLTTYYLTVTVDGTRPPSLLPPLLAVIMFRFFAHSYPWPPKAYAHACLCLYHGGGRALRTLTLFVARSSGG
eukprot:scaffold160251_cov21-Tisochrysis_lutea.AAC.1